MKFTKAFAFTFGSLSFVMIQQYRGEKSLLEGKEIKTEKESGLLALGISSHLLFPDINRIGRICRF